MGKHKHFLSRVWWSLVQGPRNWDYGLRNTRKEKLMFTHISLCIPVFVYVHVYVCLFFGPMTHDRYDTSQIVACALKNCTQLSHILLSSITVRWSLKTLLVCQILFYFCAGDQIDSLKLQIKMGAKQNYRRINIIMKERNNQQDVIRKLTEKPWPCQHRWTFSRNIREK